MVISTYGTTLIDMRGKVVDSFNSFTKINIIMHNFDSD